MKTPTNIDILPMAAVGLIMVLIMMVVSPMVMSKSSTPINLPQTHTSERKIENDVNITCTAEGDLLLDDEPVSDIGQLEQQVQSAVVKDPYVLVVVRADKECLHSSVLDILAAARRAGALRIACATKRYREG